MHSLPHLCVWPVHTTVQAPLRHSSLPVQTSQDSPHAVSSSLPTHRSPHRVKPALQVKSHALSLHLAAEPAGALQTSPHVRQFSTVLSLPPPGHVHWPFWQDSPGVHAFPHAPQLLVVLLAVHVRFPPVPQVIVPAGQVNPHTPPGQVGMAPVGAPDGNAHGVQPGFASVPLPHQFTSSLRRHVPLQSCVPLSHWHSPPSHGRPPQSVLHAPQFAESVCRFTHWSSHSAAVETH
jgi:hypothetical protein